MPEPLPRGRRFGVDVGKARVGVASSDPDGLLATPVATLRRDTKSGTDIEELLAHLAEGFAACVYVGLPQNLSGAETPSTQDAREYAATLARRAAAAGLDLEVRLIDERLTTVSAQRNLHAMGRNTKNSRNVIDQAAAVEILQQGLDMERSLGRRAGVAPVREP